jgi:hypothetical protein
MSGIPEDQQLVADALRGGRGIDQRVIAETGLRIVATLLRKNADYGSSAWKPPVMAPHLNPGDAMLCRMSDKVARISQLSNGSPEVAESLDDSVGDLGGYSILWLAFKAMSATPF